MIQRIQSIYLFLVTALLATSIFLPLGTFLDAKGMVYSFSPSAVTIPGSTVNFTPWAQLSMLILGALISLATIFLFKNRKLQIRMCVFNSLLMALYYAILCVFVMLTKGNAQLTFNPAYSVCLPLIALILNSLAVRAIRKDEAKVRATDRIR